MTFRRRVVPGKGTYDNNGTAGVMPETKESVVGTISITVSGTAVPEPGTWTASAIGLALIAYRLRRSRFRLRPLA